MKKSCQIDEFEISMPECGQIVGGLLLLDDLDSDVAEHVRRLRSVPVPDLRAQSPYGGDSGGARAGESSPRMIGD